MSTKVVSKNARSLNGYEIGSNIPAEGQVLVFTSGKYLPTTFSTSSIYTANSTITDDARTVTLKTGTTATQNLQFLNSDGKKGFYFDGRGKVGFLTSTFDGTYGGDATNINFGDSTNQVAIGIHLNNSSGSQYYAYRHFSGANVLMNVDSRGRYEWYNQNNANLDIAFNLIGGPKIHINSNGTFPWQSAFLFSNVGIPLVGIDMNNSTVPLITVNTQTGIVKNVISGNRTSEATWFGDGVVLGGTRARSATPFFDVMGAGSTSATTTALFQNSSSVACLTIKDDLSVTFGSVIELGHASDTTISRVSAGKIAIEGVDVVTVSSNDTLTNKTLTAPILTAPVTIKHPTGPTLFHFQNDLNGNVEIGRQDNVASTPYLDFHSGAVSVDYDTRILSSGGNGTSGNGTLMIYAATLTTTGAISATGSISTLSTIELGHASDTTIARVSAGVVSIEGVNIVTRTSTDTLTNKRVTPRVGTTTSSATPTINTDNVDFYELTAQAVNITSFTTNLTGTPTNGQKLWIAITGTAARTIAWGASFESSTIILPTTTVNTSRLDVGFVWNSATSKWRCVGTC